MAITMTEFAIGNFLSGIAILVGLLRLTGEILTEFPVMIFGWLIFATGVVWFLNTNTSQIK